MFSSTPIPFRKGVFPRLKNSFLLAYTPFQKNPPLKGYLFPSSSFWDPSSSFWDTQETYIHHNLFITLLLGSIAYTVLVKQPCYIQTIIPHHSNYLFMYLSYLCENVWKENDGGMDNNPKPDLDNINGQITILNQILIIPMHRASLVKSPCYLLKLSSGNENMGVSQADNSVKV